VAWVGTGQPSMVWGWVWKFLLKTSNVSIFLPSGHKKSLRVASESNASEMDTDKEI